uniref:Uncharacterized protein n=1 Tax=Ditylenchus dipsaci TaxID=166011 RepID=A0A915ET82_9BILA
MLNRIGRRGFVSLCHFLAAASFFIILFTENSRISLAMCIYISNDPTVLFGVSAGFGGVLTLFLPETNNKELPNSIDHISSGLASGTVTRIKPEMC